MSQLELEAGEASPLGDEAAESRESEPLAAGAPAPLRWRGDIQGLRGVAILAVVVYHAAARRLPGGFIGVDVFFVISGFLITSLLVRELEQTGRISLRRFYAGRIRRLLPMAIVVIAATIIAADLLQSPLDAARSAKDGLASALYVANYRFALEQTNYLNAGLAPSPFEHYWSLGVEEQMYVVWPLVLLLGALALRRRRTAHGAVAVLFIGTVASFVACVRITHADAPWAFFSFPTRAWELGVGGLLAFAVPALRTVPRFLASLVGLAGLGAILYSAFAFGATTPWPGSAAAVPVLGAAAVIGAGCARGTRLSAHLLAFPPLQFAGRISYPWYLWHWPLLILAPLALKHSLSDGQALVLVGASALLATASHYLIERPIHRSAWLARRARRGLHLGFGLTAAGSVLCLGSVAVLALPTAEAGSPVHLARPVIKTGGADPDAQLLALTTASLQHDLGVSQGIEDVPADLTPSLAGAYADEPVLYHDGCVATFTSTYLAPCDYGEPTSTTKVVLFGDSHAAMWFPAVEQAAEQYSWQLFAWAKDTCPPVKLTIFSPDLDRRYSECTSWQDEVLQRIASLHPALVILGAARHYSPIYGFTMYSEQWMDGLSEMVTAIRQLGARVLVLGPIPKPVASVPSCLSEHLDSAASCSTFRGAGVNLPGMRSEEIVVRAAGGSYLNTLFWFCSTEAVCPPILDDVLVYRDDNHITSTFATLLATPLEAALSLAARGVTPNPSAVLLGPYTR